MGAESSMNPYLAAGEAGLGAIQSIVGFIQKGKANREIKRLLSQREAFQTPDEVFQILNATQSKAANGLGAPTLDYLTGQTDRAFSGAIGASTLLGGDPNDLSAIFDQKMQNVFKIGSENHAANLANFSKYLTAVNTVAENAAAEQISIDNLLKDQIQAASARGGDATKNIQGGLNTIVSAGAQYFGSSLYNQPNSGDPYVLGSGSYASNGTYIPPQRTTTNNTTLMGR